MAGYRSMMCRAANGGTTYVKVLLAIASISPLRVTRGLAESNPHTWPLEYDVPPTTLTRIATGPCCSLLMRITYSAEGS